MAIYQKIAIQYGNCLKNLSANEFVAVLDADSLIYFSASYERKSFFLENGESNGYFY